jgi:hypothetical protein
MNPSHHFGGNEENYEHNFSVDIAASTGIELTHISGRMRYRSVYLLGTLIFEGSQAKAVIDNILHHESHRSLCQENVGPPINN